MRKVTKSVVSAFLSHSRKTQGNSTTDGETLFLHGNAIAKHESGDILVSLAGWNTPTTRDRVNAVAVESGKRARHPFFQKNFEAYFDDKIVENLREWFKL